MPARSAARQRLADLMESRRLDLGLTWREVAEAGNISYEVIRAIRHGNGQIRPLSKRGIEVGLKWEPGSVQAVLDGRDPVPLANATGSIELAPPVPEPPREADAEPAEDVADAVVTVLNARRGEPGVWAEMRDYLSAVGVLDDAAEARAWPPGSIPAKVTPRAEQALNAAAAAGTLFSDEVGTLAAHIGSYKWPLRVRMIAQLREAMREGARNPTRARRAGYRQTA